jgi:DNA-binding transcriptional ArsR family regulator
MTDLSTLIPFIKALADETRLSLLVLLSQQKPGTAFCVTRLARELHSTPGNISQHLGVLKELNLVRGERQRYRIHYYLDQAQFNRYLAELLAVLNTGHAEQEQALITHPRCPKKREEI